MEFNFLPEYLIVNCCNCDNINDDHNIAEQIWVVEAGGGIRAVKTGIGKCYINIHWGRGSPKFIVTCALLKEPRPSPI